MVRNTSDLKVSVDIFGKLDERFTSSLSNKITQRILVSLSASGELTAPTKPSTDAKLNKCQFAPHGAWA